MPSQVSDRSRLGAPKPASTTGQALGTSRIPWSSSRLAHPSTLATVGVFLALVPPLMSTPAQRSRWGVNWYLTTGDYELIAVGGALVLLGILVGASGRRVDDAGYFVVDVPRLLRASNILLVLFAVGYLVWAWSASRHGFTWGLALRTLRGSTGANYVARADLATVPGLSTLTEVGPVLAAALVLLWRCGVRRRAVMAIVLALTAVRMVLNSERLSMIEIVVPVVLMVLMTRDRRESDATRRRPWLVAGFFAAPLALLLLFAATERQRTWNSHYQRLYPGNLLQFSMDRIWAYYATAANNGAVYRDFHAPMLHFPELTLQALTSAPIVGELIQVVGGHAPGAQPWIGTLTFYANPEFNNTSTVLPVISEIGIPLALCLFAAWGVLMGVLHRQARQGRVGALVAFCGLALGLLELARYPYYSSGRFAAAALAAVIVWQTVSPAPHDVPTRRRTS